MKNPSGPLTAKKKVTSARAEPERSALRHSGAAGPGSSDRRIPEKSEPADKYKRALRGYRFQRARTSGIIEVLNENSYVMAEYSERTGSVKWQRMVHASEREQIEKWLGEHYPIS